MSRSAAFVALACFAGRAHAQDDPKNDAGTYLLSVVRGSGAESCPSRQELEREVSARLGRSPFDPNAERSIEIFTEHGPDGYRSVVSAINRGGNLLGRRVLLSDDASCAPIFSATALTVALLVDPEATLSRDSGANEAVGRFELDEPTPPPPLPRPSAPAPPRPLAPSPPAARDSSPAPSVGETRVAVTGAEAVVTIGMVPAVSPGVEIFTEGFLGSSWGFALSSVYVSKASITEGDAVLDGEPHDVRRSAHVFAGDQPFISPRHRRRTVGWRAARGVRGARAIDSGDHFYFALGAGAGAEVSVINGLLVVASVNAAIPFIERGLTVEGEDEPIWREPPVGGLAALGLGWAFF